MPDINIVVSASQEDIDALTVWFAVWNAGLTAPYASLGDAIRGECQNQVDSWIVNAKPTIRQAYEDATEAQKAEIAVEVARITGKTIGG